MKKNNSFSRYTLPILLVSTLFTSYNTAVSLESGRSGKLTWAAITAGVASTALAYRMYSHRRDASERIQNVADCYNKCKLFKELTKDDTYTGRDSVECIVRNYNNGLIRSSSSQLQPASVVRVLSQNEFPAIRMIEKSKEEFEKIKGQLCFISSYRDPYYDWLSEQGQNNVGSEMANNTAFSKWCKPLLKSIASLAHSFWRFSLYPADSIVRSNDFINGWQEKANRWLTVKGILHNKAETINKRCTHRG